MLESLDQYLANDKAFKLEDFYPGLIKQNQYQGKLYGLPRDNDTKVIFANKKLFSEAGVALPKSGWTWNELRTSATKLTKRDDSGKTTQYGYAFEPNDWWRLWIWQNGGDIFDNYVTPEPPTHLTVNTPEAIEAIQFFSDLINKDKVSPAFDMMDNSDKISELFINNQVAMAFGNHALVPLFSKTKDLDWEVIPLPAGKKRVNILDGASYTINQKSTNKAAAWQFVKFLSSELGQGFFMESGVVVPARQSIREDNIFVQRSKYNWQIFIEETQFGKPTPQFRSFNSISKLVDQELEAVWKGQKTSVAVLSTLGSKIDPELAKLKG
jgi:multiple sugar transport system substrate-binding protein